MPDIGAKPSQGADATGADTYVEVIAAPAGNRIWHCLSATVATHDAILSLDGGVTDHLRIRAGAMVWIFLGLPGIKLAVHAKNATAQSNYATLVVNVW